MGRTNGTVSCTGCSKCYSWKPELAGRKAKCKCGAIVRFPIDGPPLPEPEPVAPPQTFGEYDLHDTAKPTARSAPPKHLAAAAAKGRRGTKDACIDCGKPLLPGAVLCTACGMNQQTGRKLDTAIDKLPMALAAELNKAPVKAASNKSKWILLAAVVIIAGAGAYVAMYVYPGYAVEPAAVAPLPKPNPVPEAAPAPSPDPSAAPVPAASSEPPASAPTVTPDLPPVVDPPPG